MPIFPQGVPQTRDASGLGSSSYTGRILEAQYADAVSPRVSSALGAVEASVGLWSRCLSLCQAKPTDSRELRSITPSFLALGVCAVGRFSARSATTCRGYEHHDPLHIGVCFFCGADS